MWDLNIKRKMAYEKSGFTIEEYIEKILWLEGVSKGMVESGIGELSWTSYFDGVLFSIVVIHISEE